MCGIAGIIYQRASNATPTDWQALRAGVSALSSQTLLPDNPQSFAPLLERLETLCRGLREFAVYEEIRAQSPSQDVLREAAAALADWETRTQDAVLAPTATVATDRLEQWNALWVRSRDLGWMLERDVLASLSRVDRLLPAAFKADPQAQFQAWKLAAMLENIGRLEVRGRDSLGLSILVYFSDQAARDGFQQTLHQRALEGLWTSRQAIEDFTHGAILAHDDGIVFTFKVAQEVGALGDNVARLVDAISQDAVFWHAVASAGAETNIFSHTRWASNGIISEPNCHPINNEVFSLPGRNGTHPATPAAAIMAALNGDVDNYQQLMAQLQVEAGQTVSPQITTDTKIIPVMIAHHYKQCGDLREAFCRAVSQFEGSMAICMHSTLDPHRLYLALRGSGQALFVGLMPRGYVVASELYGVVEQTARFVRMDGTTERVAGKPETAGQVFVLDDRRSDGLSGIEAWSFDGERLELKDSDVRTAEITTRDINRGDFEHFLLKEINEAPQSVQKTLQGKFHIVDRAVHMNLGEEVFPRVVAERLRSGQARRILLIGQGTAAIAGAAVASMMERALASSPISVLAIKASELSGYSMHDDMSDSIVIAISQSGTTTDTNRTVDLARTRGAAAIAIVNRRNSDLTYKVDGVFYTSDGRDIEMSVASTKAFYSQVVAGYVIALHVALMLETMTVDQVRGELEELARLPDKMRSVLMHQEPVRTLAERWATTRRDWAVVGSGSTRAAADEVRIKLSELCYKSIATDYIEDKKHIDLSSEPLTLICTAGLGLMALRDAVKEVAIFKSHKSIPIVICSEGFDAFEPYAAGVIYVPRASENASVLLNTLVGHLWGYYCARAIDRGAAQLKPARALAVAQLARKDADWGALFGQVMQIGKNFQADMARGLYNSSLSVDTGAQLSTLFQYVTGAQSLRQFSQEFQAQGTPASVTERLVATLSKAIHELSRPIDAIKHQAKTVTVGISRLEEVFEGHIFEALRELQAPLEAIPYRDLALLRAITLAVRQVAGSTLYEVHGLGTLGQPLEGSLVRAVRKTGLAAGMKSRADAGHALVGTKEWVVRSRSSYVGLGRTDGRPIVIVPMLPSGQVEGLVLLHMDFEPALSVEQKATLLRDTHRYDDVRSIVTETDLEWSDGFLEPFTVAECVTMPAEAMAERILGRAGKPVGAGRQ
jgi:glucosamine--fructose-6-phosphate aminotransferase (isomerizing)